MSSIKAPRDHNGTLSAMRRYPGDGWVAGVCAGVADYFGWSVKVIRVLVILALIFTGFFPVAAVYIALWYLMDPAEAGDAPRPAGTAGSAGGGGPGRPGSGITPADAKARFEKLDRRLQQIEACVTQDELELRRQFKKLEV